MTFTGADPEVIRKLESLTRLAAKSSGATDGERRAAQEAISRIFLQHKIRERREFWVNNAERKKGSTRCDVIRVGYSIHEKKWSYTTTMKVQYDLHLQRPMCEWICFDHRGFPRQKAEEWWRLRSPCSKCPESVAEAVERAQCGELFDTETIIIERGEPYDSIVDYYLKGEVSCPTSTQPSASK